MDFSLTNGNDPNAFVRIDLSKADEDNNNNNMRVVDMEDGGANDFNMDKDSGNEDDYDELIFDDDIDDHSFEVGTSDCSSLTQYFSQIDMTSNASHDSMADFSFDSHAKRCKFDGLDNHPFEDQISTSFIFSPTKSINLAPEVLLKIMANLSAEDLLSCRLVNSTWNQIASLVLRQRPNNNLVFQISRTHPQVYKRWTGSKFTWKFTPLSVLTDIIRSSTRKQDLPFCKFQFEATNQEMNDLTDFLSTLGSNVIFKGLDIKTEVIPKKYYKQHKIKSNQVKTNCSLDELELKLSQLKTYALNK